MAKDILEEIVAHKRIEIEQQKAIIAPAILYSSVDTLMAEDTSKHRSMRESLANSASGIIAEFKRKSPSKGWIKEEGKAEAEYGCQLVEWLIYRLSEAVHNNVAESGWEHDKQRIYKLIAGTQTDGISRSELTRKTQWVKDKRMRNDYIDDLADAGLIVYGPAPEHMNRQWLWAVKWLSKERVTEILDLKKGEANG